MVLEEGDPVGQQHEDSHQHDDGAGQVEDQVAEPGVPRLLRIAEPDQEEGRDRQPLPEEEQGEQVAGQDHAGPGAGQDQGHGLGTRGRVLPGEDARHEGVQDERRGKDRGQGIRPEQDPVVAEGIQGEAGSVR
jgi:hypothetical protein